VAGFALQTLIQMQNNKISFAKPLFKILNMQVNITKKNNRNQLTCVRPNGTIVQSNLGPKLPFHDIAHLIVDNTYLFVIIGSLCAISFLFIQRNKQNIFIVILIGIVACGMVKVTSSVYEKLESHQKIRIDVLLGRGTINLKKEGYNVNQAKIAIGSGGFLGKGYLQGTQTKYDFVPEQDTDFIFCTVGEEWGFLGTSVVILLQLALILKIITMAERQRSDFSRIYGYGVASVLFFHLAINVGMTIGLAPVIGIPLPFFSYGGSSLWSFTILLFIFIKLDANRLSILR